MIPETVKFEVVPHVANGTFGAPVVAPLTLQFDPLAKDKVAVEPTNEIASTAMFTIPVLATVTTVPVPPVVVTVLLVLPPKFNVPAMFPVDPDPENAIAIAFAALVKFKVEPAPMENEPDAIVIVLVVVVEDEIVTAVLLVMLNEPTEFAVVLTVAPVMAAPATVPAPSIISMSVAKGVDLVVPVPSAAVFHVAAVLKSAVAVPTQ